MSSSADCTYFILLEWDSPGRFVKLPQSSVLAWFRMLWSQINRSDEVLARDLKGEPYGLGQLIEAMHNEKCPVEDRTLMAFLRENIYTEDDIVVQANFVSVHTDDDEGNVSYYFFDEHLLRTNTALDFLPSLSEFLENDPVEDVEDPAERSSAAKSYARLLRRLQMQLLATK
jgi:hypothetical protein